MALELEVNNPSRVSMLRYPLNNRDSYKASIVFTTLQPTSVGASSGDANFGEVVNSSISGLNTSFAPTGGAMVRLYMPPSVQVADGVNIENINLGFTGGAIAGALGAGSVGETVSQALEQGQKAVGQIGDLVDVMRGVGQSDTARAAAARAAQRLPEGLEGTVRAATRTAYNPNSRALFKSVNIREFSFSWKFIPTSLSESLEIEKIVKHFRTELYPELLGDQIKLAYNFPNLFEIRFEYDDREMTAMAPTLLPSYLKSVQTNYNPSMMAMHKDGHFSEVDLTLSFIENRALSRGDIESGRY